MLSCPLGQALGSTPSITKKKKEEARGKEGREDERVPLVSFIGLLSQRRP